MVINTDAAKKTADEHLVALSVKSLPDGNFEIWSMCYTPTDGGFIGKLQKVATIQSGLGTMQYHGGFGAAGETRCFQYWKMLSAMCEYFGGNDTWK